MTIFSPENLPRPALCRWQPLRAGLTDLFHYDQEEFWFRDGRLLLRGNNGTGKSKVLALTLPFLLDGQLTPARVEPDGDPGKRMEWNLLLGGKYPERLGYSWLEFGRLSDEGRPEFFTIGCGLRAVTGQGAPKTWFFTTSCRIGVDLFLVGAGGFALNRERLAESLGESGSVFESAGRYRQAVDEKLFRLGEERYRALIDLLIQLRQPQLSKRPNEKALSAALTQALPPLDQAVLQDVAEAFRNLESERDELSGLQEARRAVDDFRRHYRAYAAIAARRKAAEVRTAQSRYEKTARELQSAKTQLEEASVEKTRLEEGIENTGRELEKARTEERTLRDSPEMRSADALHQAEELAREKEESAKETRSLAEGLEEAAGRGAADLGRLEEEVVRNRQETFEKNEALESLLVDTGMGRDHEAIFSRLHLPDGEGEPSEAQLVSSKLESEELCSRRGEQVAHLEKLSRRLKEANGLLKEERRRLQELEADKERLAEGHAGAAAALESCAQALVKDFERFAAGLRELPLEARELAASELEEWTKTLSGENPARAAVEDAYRQAARALAVAEERTHSEDRDLEEQEKALESEWRRLTAGETPVPQLAPTRDGAGRADCPGAPFWQLVDFPPEVPATERAGIEAALEAAGLLDAWVTPEGALLGPEQLDVALKGTAPADRHLGAVLRPALDPDDRRAREVKEGVVAAVLSSIGWGECDHPAWIAADGRWRLGPAFGRWYKESAVYLGHAAREEGRRRRLAELGGQLERIGEERTSLAKRLELLEKRLHRLDAEVAACPPEEAVREAHRKLTGLTSALSRQQERCTEAETQVRKQQEVALLCRKERDEAAEDLQLPTEEDALDRAKAALEEYRVGLAGFWPCLRTHWQTMERCHRARREQRQARERADRAIARAEQAEQSARAAAARRDTLRQSLGESVAALEERLAATETRIRILVGEEKCFRDALQENAGLWGRAENEAKNRETELQERDERRREAVLRLQAFAAEGLLSAAAPGIELPEKKVWAVDPAVRLARRVEQQLEGVDDGDSAWDRHQRKLHEQVTTLQTALSRHGHEAVAEQTDSGLTVWVMFQGRRLTPDGLAEGLTFELQERRRILDEKERELLETHLISEVARQLQELISDAEAQVARMNHELEIRPTSTGMKLRFQWLPLVEGEEDAPAGLSEARRRLLRQVADAWSTEDREAVGRFLQDQINRVRAADEGGTLLEHLERALDYRRWHRFAVERFQDGRWKPASGPASGGERVLAVTLPLFAAASAHYSSAAAEAPRPVMLDEAFAGVDDDSRAKCMGLLSQFDLDVVMTSEREWGCYPDVSGLAIHQLARRDGIDAIYVSRWEWDGRIKRRAEHPLPPMQAPSTKIEETDAEESSGSLF